MRTVSELRKFLKRYLPDCTVDTDEGGEVTIHTGLVEEDGVLVPVETDNSGDTEPERPEFGRYRAER